MRFKPDPEIFKTSTTFEFDRVSGRLDELAYLNAGISISLEDKRCVLVLGVVDRRHMWVDRRTG